MALLCCRRRNFALQCISYREAVGLQVIERYLFEEQDFRLPSFGASNVPAASVVDHPGQHTLPCAAVSASSCTLSACEARCRAHEWQLLASVPMTATPRHFHTW